jgi:hypothetical protein
MAASIGFGRTRTVLWALFALVAIVFIIDGGSCTIARMQVDEDAKTAARHAVQQIGDSPINQQTAIVAYNSATEALPNPKERILTAGPGVSEAERFRVGEDGTITMTVVRPAPTLLFKYLPKLRDFTEAKVTYTQQPLGF